MITRPIPQGSIPTKIAMTPGFEAECPVCPSCRRYFVEYAADGGWRWLVCRPCGTKLRFASGLWVGEADPLTQAETSRRLAEMREVTETQVRTARALDLSRLPGGSMDASGRFISGALRPVPRWSDDKPGTMRLGHNMATFEPACPRCRKAFSGFLNGSEGHQLVCRPCGVRYTFGMGFWPVDPSEVTAADRELAQYEQALTAPPLSI